tara:strand:- start:303 stop:560 length:258 start_codon:yes stop_codon:yes gene_type:complete
VTISGVVHSVGYEITFLAVIPAAIATNPITKIHLDLSPESNLFIKLVCRNQRHKSLIDIRRISKKLTTSIPNGVSIFYITANLMT